MKCAGFSFSGVLKSRELNGRSFARRTALQFQRLAGAAISNALLRSGYWNRALLLGWRIPWFALHVDSCFNIPREVRIRRHGNNVLHNFRLRFVDNSHISDHSGSSSKRSRFRRSPARSSYTPNTSLLRQLRQPRPYTHTPPAPESYTSFLSTKPAPA